MAKMGLEFLCSLNCVTCQKFINQMFKSTSVIVGADYMFGPVIWIWKDLAQCISGTMVNQSHPKQIKTKVAVHYHNI
jgi:hypothetical protein